MSGSFSAFNKQEVIEMMKSGEIPYSLDKYDVKSFTLDDKIMAEDRYRNRKDLHRKIADMCRELIPLILKRNIL